MTHYIHHVPGRLRVKTAAVKGSERNARRVREHFAHREGVQAVEASVVTGSVIMRYDAAAVSGEVLIGELRGLALLPEASPRHEVVVQRSGEPPLAEHIAGKVATRIVETVIERSALALIGALI